VGHLGRLAVLPLLLATAPVLAKPARVLSADSWIVYGAPVSMQRDEAVPGAGSVTVAPLAKPAEPWTSGAVAIITDAIPARGSVTAIFWARAAAPVDVAVTMQDRTAPYTPFLQDKVHLTPRWQRFVRTGMSTAALAAGTQALTVQLGQSAVAVSLGPVALSDGPAKASHADTIFADFHPDHVAETVSIASAPGVVLAGTLRTPVGHGKGPFPLAICVQGSGRNGRGGFPLVMDRLLADGIATLEYDKRGIGASTGTYEEDIEKLAGDTRAAVSAMRRRSDIDGARIAIVGHSQGGAIAPMVAAQDNRIAAIVSFAGPVGDGPQLFTRSMHDQLIAAGRKEETVAPLVAASLRLLEARQAKADAATLAPLRVAVRQGLVATGFTAEQAEGALTSLDTVEVSQVLDMHIASDIRALHIPVLSLFAALDPLVPPTGNAAAARLALADNPRGKVMIFEGQSHWFKDGAKTGTQAENETLGPNLGSPRVIATTGDFLRAALNTKPRER